jgi:glutamate racemase
MMAEVQPWPVKWLDPAPAIARRLEQVLGRTGEGLRGDGFALFTSGRAPPVTLLEVLERYGVPLLSKGLQPSAQVLSLTLRPAFLK